MKQDNIDRGTQTHLPPARLTRLRAPRVQKQLPPVFYVIYDHPDDFPHAWVVRVCELQSDGSGLPTPTYHLAVTLDAARALIPEGRCNIGRSAEDAGSIFEIWF